MPRENAQKIENDVLKEIKFALGLSEPPATISIPPVVASPPSFEDTDEDHYDDDDDENEKYDKEDTPARISYTASDLDDDANSLSEDERALLMQLQQMLERRTSSRGANEASLRDSFIRNLSFISSSVGGSVGTNSESMVGGNLNSSSNANHNPFPTSNFNSSRYHIGSIDENSSLPSQGEHSDAGNNFSKDELTALVHRLYQQLKESDKTFAVEKQRRKHREKSLMKLAKELGRLKDVLAQHEARLEEMREELRMAYSEKAMLEQQLDFQNQAKEPSSQPNSDQKVQQVVRQYEILLSDQEERINDMNKSHAKHCEQLCKEVVEANQESMRLQKKLAELTNGGFLQADRKMANSIPSLSSISTNQSFSNRRPKKSERAYGTTMLFLGLGLVWYKADVIRSTLHEVYPPSRNWSSVSTHIPEGLDEKAFQDVQGDSIAPNMEDESFQARNINATTGSILGDPTHAGPISDSGKGETLSLTDEQDILGQRSPPQWVRHLKIHIEEALQSGMIL